MSTKERSLILSALGSDNSAPLLNLRHELQKQLLDSFFIIIMDNSSQSILWAIGSYPSGRRCRGSRSTVWEAARISGYDTYDPKTRRVFQDLLGFFHQRTRH